MWQVVNHTRFAVGRSFARDVRGAEVWLVAVRATFAIAPSGRLDADVAQEPVALGPAWRGAPGRSSLRWDTDLPLLRPGTDVIVNGHACAPGGVATTRVEVRLTAGSITKSLLVTGDRTFRRTPSGVAPSDPAPFVRLPIVYERAFGGVDPRGGGAHDARNPLGVGFAERPEDLVGTAAPNVEHPGARLAAGDASTPAGFGAIDRGWAPRSARGGTYDDAWRAERMPLAPLDLDPRFFHAAPDDQQVPGYLREGATIELTGMSPEGALRFALPRVRPCFQTSFGREVVAHRGRLHTVIIEPDERRVMVVWHSALACHGREHRLDRTVVWEKLYV